MGPFHCPVGFLVTTIQHKMILGETNWPQIGLCCHAPYMNLDHTINGLRVLCVQGSQNLETPLRIRDTWVDDTSWVGSGTPHYLMIAMDTFILFSTMHLFSFHSLLHSFFSPLISVSISYVRALMWNAFQWETHMFLKFGGVVFYPSRTEFSDTGCLMRGSSLPVFRQIREKVLGFISN